MAPATTTETRYAYNAAGALAAEYGPAEMESDAEYFMADRLGSVVMKGSQRYHYYPYDQEIGGATTNDTPKFGTYTRAVSGLDYAMNRFYNSQQGRFMSPDPYMASGGVADPGSWNRYAYVGGDPVNWYDPLGLDRWDPSTNTLYGDRSAMAGVSGGGRTGPDMYLPDERAGYGEYVEPISGAISDIHNYLLGVRDGLAYAVTNLGLGDCQALHEFAQLAHTELAKPFGVDGFVDAFGVLTPSDSMKGLNTIAELLGIKNSPGDTRLNRSGSPSTFSGQYHDEINNADQAHHFAVFLQIGYHGGFVEGSIIAVLWEAANGTPGNVNDIRLGIAAASIGNALKQTGNIASAVRAISDLCDK